MTNMGYQTPRPGADFQPTWLCGVPVHTILAAYGGGEGDDEGADPSDDIRKQNPGETTTPDLAEGEGEGETKVQDLAKAGREHFDPNEESPA